ncbi:hypothetical protein [Sphingomonas oleivorans]|uniref:hypothetical protein n=1 Tax=Sphingomonas oleivorans TaxID=1735121 RepID=UPI00105746BA|nr:hypothetical protein [Sphingomonas oleivorans]
MMVAVGLVSCQPSTLDEAQTAVKDLLNDPQSAQFKEMETPSTGVACGEVNSKNAMGGYSDYTPFVFVSDRAKPRPVAEDRGVHFYSLDGAREYFRVSEQYGCAAPGAWIQFKASMEKIGHKFAVE